MSVGVVFAGWDNPRLSGSNDNTVKLWDVAVSMRTLAKISGDEQQGTFGSTLANPLVVEVRDRDNNPLQVFKSRLQSPGQGLLSGQSTVRVTTDASGRAARTLTLGPYPDGKHKLKYLLLARLVTFNAVGISPYQSAKISGDAGSTFAQHWRTPWLLK